MQEHEYTPQKNHHITMENRSRLVVSGVNDVDSFDENLVVLFTDMGELTVKGTGLHISRLDVDTGELEVEGEFIAFYYTEAPVKKSGGSVFSRIFR